MYSLTFPCKKFISEDILVRRKERSKKGKTNLYGYFHFSPLAVVTLLSFWSSNASPTVLHAIREPVLNLNLNLIILRSVYFHENWTDSTEFFSEIKAKCPLTLSKIHQCQIHFSFCTIKISKVKEKIVGRGSGAGIYMKWTFHVIMEWSKNTKSWNKS